MEDYGKTAEENITPHFYNIHNDGKSVLKDAENSASRNTLGDSSPRAGDSAKNHQESNFSSNVAGRSIDGKNTKGFVKTLGKIGASVLVIVLILVAMLVLFLTPQFLIGNIDYNLQRVLGFGDTVAVLEKQAEYVTATALKEGKVRDDYAVDLESSGLLVGQIAANGEFVRTNTYIADLGVPKELASTGAAYGNEALDISLGKQEDGQLVMKYNNEVINGDNFVAKVESDPKMYYAYSTALDIASRYYYSDEVTSYYNENGLSRNSFAAWTPSGNKQTDDENFKKIIERVLAPTDAVGIDGLDMEWYEMCGKQGQVEKCESKTTYKSEEECKSRPIFSEKKWESCEPEYELRKPNGAACSDDGDSQCTETLVGYKGSFDNKSLDKSISEFADADELTAEVGNSTLIEGDPETSKEKAVLLLNSAMSANEPYASAKVFLAIEESINKARALKGGPVNQAMDLLAQSAEITVTDPATGEAKTIKDSVLNTRNFAVAASDGGPYSKEDAAMFSRDSILNTMNNHGGTKINTDKINNTSVSTNTSKQSNMLITMNHEGDTAGDLTLTNNTLNNTFFDDSAITLSSALGGNRTVGGGDFLSGDINKYAIGALPSDTEQMFVHNNVVQEVIARKAEAERASLSPFDISSKNTFFGRIAHDFASVMIRNYGNNNGISMASVASAAAGLTNYSVSTIMNGAYAAAEESYTMLNGDCPTPNSAAMTNGTLYCNSHQTVYTGYMDYTIDDYKNNELIGSSLDEEGGIKDDGGIMGEIVALGSGRDSIVGNSNADVCERYVKMMEDGGEVTGGFKKIAGNFVGVNQYVLQYERCANDVENENDEVDGSTKRNWSSIWDLFGFAEEPKEPEVPVDVATGAKYTLSESNPENETMKVYSAYSMYQMVRSMLTDNENEVTAFKERYYAKYPKDNSAAGIIARRSGMTKKEAQIALNYADYLNAIARYDASTRMAFGKINLNIEVEDVPLVIKENQEFNNELALIVANKNGQIVRREDKTTV